MSMTWFISCGSFLEAPLPSTPSSRCQVSCSPSPALLAKNSTELTLTLLPAPPPLCPRPACRASEKKRLSHLSWSSLPSQYPAQGTCHVKLSFTEHHLHQGNSKLCGGCVSFPSPPRLRWGLMRGPKVTVKQRKVAGNWACVGSVCPGSRGGCSSKPGPQKKGFRP